MSSTYLPAPGQPRMIRSFDDLKKINVSKNPRSFQAGSLLWLNKVVGRYQAEPYLLSPTNAATDSTASNSTASTYTAGIVGTGSCGVAAAALFLGIAGEARIPQQFNNIGQFSAQGTATAALMDASKPFITYYDEGIAAMPIGPSMSATFALTAAVEVGTLVYADGFLNEGTTGFYDPAGALQKQADYYNYSNCVTTASVLTSAQDAAGAATDSAASAIGVVVERAEIGSSILIVKFKSAVFSTRLGGV